MNDEILLRLTGLMQNLGFTCADGSYTKAEMCAYAAGLSLVKNELNEGFNQIFTDTMGSQGILMYCDLLGIDSSSEEEELKEKIVTRLSENYRLVSEKEYDEVKKNVQGYLEMYMNMMGWTFYIKPVTYETLAAFSQFRKNYYLVHRQLLGGGLGMTFDELDGLNLRWFEFEELDFPFEVWNTIWYQ